MNFQHNRTFATFGHMTIRNTKTQQFEQKKSFICHLKLASLQIPKITPCVFCYGPFIFAQYVCNPGWGYSLIRYIGMYCPIG